MLVQVFTLRFVSDSGRPSSGSFRIKLEGTDGKTAIAGGVGADDSMEARSARLEALAALFRSIDSTRNAESLQHFSEVLGGVSRLSGNDFPELTLMA